MKSHKLGIVLSTTREGRFADKPAAWIEALAAGRPAFDAEIVDLRDYPMPFFAEPASPAYAPSKNEVAQRWQEKVAGFDAFIFVTAEYNHSVPGVLKNALDYAYREFNRKPAAFVGYGGVGGARAVEHLRHIAVELQMAPLRPAVHIAGGDYMALAKGEKTLDDMPHLATAATAMLDDLAWWTAALSAARVERAVEAA